MGPQAVGGTTANPSTTAVVWRWKGTRADIVRIARAVREAAGAPTLAIVLTDAMGSSALTDADQLEQALGELESFKTLAFEAGIDQGPCKVTVLFDAAGVYTKAAVTIVATGRDAMAVKRAYGAAVRAAAAGAREPKDVEPAEIEKWGGIASLALPAAGLLAALNPDTTDATFVLFIVVLFAIGVASMVLWLGYEALVPQIELLHPGQAPRLQKLALWVASTVGALAIGAVASGAI